MSAAKARALAVFQGLDIKWEVAGQPINAVMASLEEVEHFRPVVEAAKAFVDARSGAQRSNACGALFDAVDELRKSGR